MKEKIKSVGAGLVPALHIRNTQKGITLIALIVSIIVLLILTIVSINIVKSGIIDKANEGVSKYEIEQYKEQLALYVIGHPEVKENPINTSGYDNMKKYIPSFQKKHENKLKIANNQLVYMNDNVTEEEKQLFDNVGLNSDEMTQIYYLDENNKEQILEINDATISATSYTSKNVAKDKITKVIIGSSCQTISQKAFYSCTALTEVIAETTKQLTIGGSAFSTCSELKNIKITNIKAEGNWSYTFFNCLNLINVELGSKEHMIPSEAVFWRTFEQCNNQELVIKAYTEKNSNYDENIRNFKGVDSSNHATIITYNSTGEENNIIIGQKYKGKDIAWESLSEFEDIKDINKITEIRESAFEGCEKLKLTSLPNNLQRIEKRAFVNCSNLQIDKIPATCILIGTEAFKQCNKIKNMTIETTNQVTVEPSAFGKCLTLETVKITNVAFTGGYQFWGSPNLINVELGSTEHIVTSNPFQPFSDSKNANLKIIIYTEQDDNYTVRINNLKFNNNATIIVRNSNGEQIN